MEQSRQVPCDHCRKKHLKCNVEQTPCIYCTKLKQACIRTRKRYRFSKAKPQDAKLGFDANQTWVKTRNADKLSFVDSGAALAGRASEAVDVRGHAQQDEVESGSVSTANNGDMAGESEDETLDQISGQEESMPNDDGEMTMDYSPPYGEIQNTGSVHDGMSVGSRLHQIRNLTGASFTSPAARSESALLHRISSDPYHNQLRSPQPATQPAFESPSVHHYATSPLDSALRSRAPSTALRGLPDGLTESAYLQLREACLMRHYVQNLASWFDASDRDRHYTVVVPQRAMFCPVLLYAIYTASSRHLTRLWHKRNSGSIVEFEGIRLPGLTEDSAIHYHNKCINFLIEISNDPSQSYNEDALTAATILRFYEQIDTPLTGQDSETYLNVVRAVVETQQDEAFYSIRKIHGPLRDHDPFIPVAVSLRHSACLMALRQEIWSVLLYRRPLQLPINPNNDFELIIDPPPADDFVWANRIFVWTADVLKFCYGGLDIRKPDSTPNNPSPSLNVDSKSRVDQWSTLKRFESTWLLQQPASFRPIYYREANVAGGRVFPEIWHNSDVQVLALQHVEIASMLLQVYDPRQPRLGLEALSAHRTLAASIRKATLRICGLAISNRICPPALVDAAVAISMCGSYFEEADKCEQNALIQFLTDLEEQHAWPTSSVVVALREAWAEGTPRPRML